MNEFNTVQETFDRIYGSLPIPIFLFDEKARLVKANQAFIDLSGANAADLQSFFVSSFFEVLKTYRFPVPDRYVTELTSLSGEVIPVELNYTKFSGADDYSKGCIVFLTDLRETHKLKEHIHQLFIEMDALKIQLDGEEPDRALLERKKLEQQLKDEKAFLENILESCGDGIIIFDGKGTITRVNEAFTKITGKDKNKITGNFTSLGPYEGTFKSTTGDMIVLDQSYREYIYSQVETFIKLKDGGKIENWELYAFNKNGEVVPLDATATVQRNASGLMTGSVCVLRNSTERKKAERSISEAYQFRSQFFTNITHEFRTPLTLIIGPIEEILRGALGTINKSISGQLTVALMNARRLLKLINQLLDFSMLESGAKNIVFEKKDLKKFTTAILDSFATVAKKKHIKLNFHAEPDIPDVPIDSGKMEKILFNLIGNAFKFTPERGSINVTIMNQVGFRPGTDWNEMVANDFNIRSVVPAGNCAKISIHDTGIGIKEEDLTKIFDRFNQGSLSYNHRQGGAGIGLAYAKELTEFMGGHITVKSQYGKGSTFSIYLPIDKPLINKETDTQTSTEELSLQAAVELSDIYQGEDSMPDCVSGTKPLIFIVDDNPDVRQYISGIIIKDYDFITASTGKEALQKLETHVPDVILCDIMMPELDGHELLKRVKATPGLQEIPFIFLTSRAETTMKIEGLEKGADDYIVKPFNSLELLARINSLLRIRDLLRKAEVQEKRIDTLTQKLQEKYNYGNIIGSAPSMRKIYQLIEAIKDSDSNVLITGETGTGKELVANAIHYNSLRKNGPLVSVNCGAIPKELMEREFFGHVKGAYTGAADSRNGYFAEADKGTLFLDEIGELDKDLQVKLLRVLERGEMMRVGDSKPIKIDVRLIAATNKNLLAEVQRGIFREDLYYRIHVIPLHLPPLRHRADDIPMLINHFLNNLQGRLKKEVPKVTEKELTLFMNYSYPGNVRELENIVERFCLLGGDVSNLFNEQSADTDLFPAKGAYNELFSTSDPLKTAVQRAKEHIEKDIIFNTLKICNNNYVQAAKKLKISRAYLYEKVKKYREAKEQ
jgi:PAS domain S-box-containing protein